MVEAVLGGTARSHSTGVELPSTVLEQGALRGWFTVPVPVVSRGKHVPSDQVGVGYRVDGVIDLAIMPATAGVCVWSR